VKLLVPSFAVSSLLFLFAITSGADCSKEDSALQRNRDIARKIAQEAGYEHFITQYAKEEEKHDPGLLKLLKDYILNEINHESVMRDEIGDRVADLETNGRNQKQKDLFYTRDKLYCVHLDFSPGDLDMVRQGVATQGKQKYLAVLKAEDNAKDGCMLVKFKFSFNTKREYFESTKDDMVTVVSYPKFEGVDEIECLFSRSNNPKECR
jgi:hypothetical protein